MTNLGAFLSQFEKPAINAFSQDANLRLGHVGRDLGKNRSDMSIFGAAVTGAVEHPYKVVTFFATDGEHAGHAARLRASLERNGIPHDLTQVESRGALDFNGVSKAAFIRYAWQASDVPIVWLDADSTVEAPPSLFGTITADFAAHKRMGWELGSGPLYFDKSDLAGQLLDQWVTRCEADPITWNGTHLQSAWCDTAARAPLRTVWLPSSYLQFVDAPFHEPPVIKHWQAFRTSEAESDVTSQPDVHMTKEGQRDRADDRLWRTAEEAFWIAQGVGNIKPETGAHFPEGFDVGAALHEAVGDLWPVIEIGCGVGRIASLFAPSTYIGGDINPSALIQARRALPDHHFRLTDAGYAYPAAPTALVYTVLLHISDEALAPFLAAATAGRQRFIIAEIMDSRWRRDGDPPVFNRNPEDYVLAMQNFGFRLSSVSKKPYQRYDCEPWNIGRDSRLTILTFDREP